MKNMNITHFKISLRIALLLVGIVIPSFLFAQDPQTGELKDVEIEIITERQINLPPANRNFEKIPPKPSEPIKPPITYDFRAFTFQTPQISPVIRPLKLKDTPKSEMYGGYL